MLFDWFKRKAPSTPVESAEPTRVPPERASGEPTPSVAAAADEGDAPPPDPGGVPTTLLARLRERVAERTRALLAPLRAQPGTADVRRLLEGVMQSEDSSIRPIPTAAARAMALARNPQSNLNDVADAFERDPSLAEGLLRLANSSWYRGGDERADSLREALQRTGSSGAEVVIMENALKSTLCRPGGAYDSLVTQVWLHLSRTAQLARSLSGTFGVEPDTAYMLGLLHDAGKLVLFDALSEQRHRARAASHIPYPILRAILHELHEPLGGLAMLRWELDMELATAVADHHRRNLPHQTSAESEMLYVAERADLTLNTGGACDLAKWIEAGGLEMGPGTLQCALDDATGGALRFAPAPGGDALSHAA